MKQVVKYAIAVTVVALLAGVIYLILNSFNDMGTKPITVTELKTETIQQGTGEGAVNGDRLTVHYVGTLENGTKFDSSYDRNETFELTLGAGQVIKGWDQGLVGMKKGEKRKLTIPYDLAYGASGSGTIPGYATLVFEVELVDLKK